MRKSKLQILVHQFTNHQRTSRSGAPLDFAQGKLVLPSLLLRAGWRSSALLVTLLFAICYLPALPAGRPSAVCYAQSVSSAELIEHAKEYDNKTVEFEGEAIGDMMKRKDGTWLNISDQANAIGVWSDRQDLNTIKHMGDYNTKGDYLRVTGVFHRACKEHGGDLDIHISGFELLAQGMDLRHPVNFAKLNIGIALSVAASILAAAYLIRKAFYKGK